jgi:ribonuclease R
LGLLGGRVRPLLGSREIVRRLGLIRVQVDPLKALLQRLAKKGVLEAVGGRFRMRRQDDLVEGAVEVGGDGSPYLRDGDRLLRLGELGGAVEGDRVRAKEFGSSPIATAELVEVLEGPQTIWIGSVEQGRRGYELIPYRGRERESLPIMSRDLLGAQVGEMVKAELVARSSGSRGSGVRVVEVFGNLEEAEARFRAVAWHRRLPTTFSQTALEESEAIPERIATAELDRRTDLRDRCFITIDPETARDHDDAVFVEATEPSLGFRMWVAIADVSHFVQPGSELDGQAWIRGNSVYFPGRSIPMLPERISSDICSLRPDVDRLVIAVEMEIDLGGKVQRSRLHEAVIRSRSRLSYAQAAESLGKAGLGGEPSGAGPALPQEVCAQIRRLDDVTERMARRRRADQSIDFDLPQPEVVLDRRGRPRDIRRAAVGPAHRMVEEAMLAANQSVARVLRESGQAAVFRVHEPPGGEDLRELGDFYRGIGLLRGRRGAPLDRAAIARALAEARGRPEEAAVHYSTLRAMKQARYASNCSGHFALGFDSYLHFTSPIRRYADLVVHRAVRRMLSGLVGAEQTAEWADRVAIRTSARERVAVAAEREMVDLARCAVMRERVGDHFKGTITGVADHGLYITLDRPFVEGMVRISRLSGFFDYDPIRHRLVAQGSRLQYRIGDRVKVQVTSVNSLRGWVDLDLVVEARTKNPPVGDKSERSGSKGLDIRKYSSRPGKRGRKRRGRR